MRLIFIFLLLTKICVGKIDSLNYIGTLTTNNQIINFNIVFVEKNGIVNGYSITNKGLKDETKSIISGVYYRNNKTYQIQETKILYTKSEEDLNSFCYINMSLQTKGRFRNKRLEGKFEGRFLDGKQCASGEIAMMEKRKIEKKIKKINKRIKKVNKESETQIISDTTNTTINWKNNMIELLIWDFGNEDGDRIEIKINDEIILSNYETKNKKKKIRYYLKEGENIIKLKALNLGINPPNTSKIELLDMKKRYPLISQLHKGKETIIRIIK